MKILIFCFILSTITWIKETNSIGFKDPTVPPSDHQCELATASIFIFYNICPEIIGNAVVFTDLGKQTYTQYNLKTEDTTICDYFLNKTSGTSGASQNNTVIYLTCAIILAETFAYAPVCGKYYSADASQVTTQGQAILRFASNQDEFCRPNLAVPDSARAFRACPNPQN